jgi:beta-glucosidase
LGKTKLKDTEILTVSCKVKNTGKVKGKEAVQVYVRDIQSIANRPVRELKDFTKIELAPGEEKHISFNLDKRAFAYYEPKLHDWYVESGVFIVEMGSSSRDIRLSGEIEVHGTKTIPVQFDRDSAIDDILQTERGRAVMAAFNGGQQQQSRKGNTAHNLGGGGEKLIERMRTEMPLSYLVNLGFMSEEQLENLLTSISE